jgi:hypothetical protein
MEDRPMSYFCSGGDHLVGLAGGDSSQLRAFFLERIRECDTGSRHEELFTVGLFDDLAAALRPEIALDLIPTAVAIALEWRTGALFDLALVQLETIARASRTTEVQPALNGSWGLLRDAVESYVAAGQLGAVDAERAWSSLSTWYRRS